MTHSLSTPITRMLDIRYPVLAGGMMWLSDARFVAAVGRAGGLGYMTARSYADIDAFKQALRDCERYAEGAPYGVNLTLSAHTDNTPMLRYLDAALAHGVRRFETAGMPPPAGMIETIHRAGGVLLHKCASVRHAVSAQAAGVDIVGLVGMEEGGHPGAGDIPTSLLGALAAQRLSIPFALGGGIGSGGQIVGALAVGAGAVVMGSRFLACDEIWAHGNYKDAIVAADEHGSMRLLGSMGRTWRVLVNNTARQVAEMEAAGIRDYARYSPLISGRIGRDACYTGGDWQQGMLSAGPAVAFTHARQPVENVMQALMAEARCSLEGLSALLPQAVEQA